MDSKKKPNGTLIFKWSETDIKVSQILSLTDQKPVIGHKSGKMANEPVAPIDMGLELQVTNHGDRCWVGVIKQWIEEGQSFLIFESESEKQRLIMTLVQLNMFANYDRFEWVG